MIPSSSAATLAEAYAHLCQQTRQRFENTGDGQACVADRASLIDAIVARLYLALVAEELTQPKDFCLVALGGYGRGELFPHSDIDLLFLSVNGNVETSRREAVAAMVRSLWDLPARVGNASRTIAECGRSEPDNPEFTLALLDCRYVAGDPQLFARLRGDTIPRLMARDGQSVIRGLSKLISQRHARYGHTLFHLEPDVKESPGGLRDYHAARWLTLVSELERAGRWVVPEARWPAALATPAQAALQFLCAVRCFLHFRQGRDDNQLSYQAQEAVAASGIGSLLPKPEPAEWMRAYFRHVRAIERLTRHLLEEITPARSGLYGLFQDWRSRLSNPDFGVLRGRIYPRQSVLGDDPALLLRLFEMVARHGVELSREAERWVEESVPRLAHDAARWPALWSSLRRILCLPHAAKALRTMHATGLLGTFFPEFRAIDGLVLRDYFHRYTVDEHSFMTIECLQALRRNPASSPPSHLSQTLRHWEQKYAELFAELERPDLLFLSLLFHDVGKGMTTSGHVQASLRAAEAVAARLWLRRHRARDCFLSDCTPSGDVGHASPTGHL